MTEGLGDHPLPVAQRAQEIVTEINVFRRDPRKYAERLVPLQEYFDGSTMTYPSSGLVVESLEGTSALKDCLSDLRSAAPLPEVVLSPAICRACVRHLDDLRNNDFCSHIGMDGSTPEARLSLVGEHREQCGENLVFGMYSATDIVYCMLIDDGSPDRGHRANLLNADFRFVGAAHDESHPSAGSACVVLLTDHFKAKQARRHEVMRGVLENAAADGGTAVLDGITETADLVSHKSWDQLMQDVKPEHLKVPKKLIPNVHSMDKPQLYGQTRVRVSKFLKGNLEPLPSVDPAIVRSFVHRIDSDHDDLLLESDVYEICRSNQLSFSPMDVEQMFDAILATRVSGDMARRAVDWAEVYAEVRPHKKWVPAVDVHVETADGDRYQLTFEADAVVRTCQELYAQFSPICEGLAKPPELNKGASAVPASSSSSPARAIGRKSPLRSQDLNTFITSLLAATVTGTYEPLWQHTQVQHLLGPRADNMLSSEPLRILTAVASGQRRLWAHHTRPHRDAWLKLLRSVGLNAVVALADHRPPGEIACQPIGSLIGNEIASVSQKNVARAPQRYTGLPPSVERMVVRDVPKKMYGRSQAPTSPTANGGETSASTRDILDITSPPKSPSKTAAGSMDILQVLDEKRHQAENLVNQCVVGNGLSASASADPGSPQVTYSFEARRKFTQSLNRQQRASEEQGFFASASSPKLGTHVGSSTSLAGQSMVSSPTKAQVGRMMRARGAGSHSLHSPQGVRGHFHNTTAIHSAEGSHGWPQSLDVRWDGNHIDHARDPPLKADPKFSQMTGEERNSQFSTYFGRAVHDNIEAKHKVARDQLPDADKFRAWKNSESREDAPDRHGRFGRRVFDPQVREKPMDNPHRVSEIDNKPHEEHSRQLAKVEEILERAMPLGQERHFRQYQPPCEQPHKYEDFVNRNQIRYAMDGGQKKTTLGFGQNRHSGSSDPDLYIRPLGAGHMDRKVPLS